MAECDGQTTERSNDGGVAEMSSGPRDFFSNGESRLEREFEKQLTSHIAKRKDDPGYLDVQEEVEDSGPSVTQRLVNDKGDYEDRPKPVPLLLLSNEESGIKIASDSTSPNATPYPNVANPRVFSGHHGTTRRRDPINCYVARWLEQNAEAEGPGYSVRCHSPILSGSIDITNFANNDAAENEYAAQLAEADKMEKFLKNNEIFNIRAIWSDDVPSHERTREIREEKLLTSEKVVKKIPSRLVHNLPWSEFFIRTLFVLCAVFRTRDILQEISTLEKELAQRDDYIEELKDRLQSEYINDHRLAIEMEELVQNVRGMVDKINLLKRDNEYKTKDLRALEEVYEKTIGSITKCRCSKEKVTTVSADMFRSSKPQDNFSTMLENGDFTQEFNNLFTRAKESRILAEGSKH